MKKHYFVSYYWTRSNGDREHDNFVYHGSFIDLIVFMKKQNEGWTLVWCKEINKSDFEKMEESGIDDFT